MEYATVPGNRVAVCSETSDLDAYMKILDSPTTAEAMKGDVWFLQLKADWAGVKARLGLK